MHRIPILHNYAFAVGSVVAVFVVDIILLKRGHVVGDYIAAAYFALYGVYCSANYFSCREVHCAVTGPGFLLAALVMVLRITGVMDYGYGLPYLVFAAAAIMGHSFECVYARRTGSRYHAGSPK